MDDNEWMRSEMDALRISQREIADVIGIDPSGVSRILGGRRRPTPGEKELLRNHFAKVREAMDQRHALPPELGPLDHALRVAGMDVFELARRSGLDEMEIGLWLGPEGRVPFDRAEKLSNILGVRPGLLTGAETHQQYRASRRRFAPRPNDAPPISQPRGTVPVYAPPVEETDGRLLCEFDMLELRQPPPELQGVARAYGLYIGDGDHGCRYRSGDIAWLRAGRPVRPGDEVLAVMAPRVWLGRLERTGMGGHAIRIGDRVEEVDVHAELHHVVGLTFG